VITSATPLFKEQPRAPPAPPTERDYVSYSALSAYRRCPLSYYFRYKLGLPEETVSASLVFGTAIHLGLQRHFQELLAGNDPPSVDELLAEYEVGWAERSDQTVIFGAGETRVSLDALAKRMFDAFLQSPAAQPGGRILGVEETLRGEFIPGMPDLLGRVDLIVEAEDALVIADWKSSRSKWSAAQVEDATEQLLCYAALAGNFAPGKPIRLEFSVLTKTKEVQVERHQAVADPRSVDRTRRIVDRVWRAIEDEHFYPAPSPMSCGSCAFRKPCRKWPG
jgi:putative RecB family exonuclease